MPRVGGWGASAVRTAPWTRAPVLLLSQPAVVAAVAGAMLVLTAAAAAQPLFLSSAGNRSLATQLAERCEWSTGGTLSVDGPAPGLGNAVAAEADRIPRIGEPVRTAITPALNASLATGTDPATGATGGTGGGGSSVLTQLMTRTGAPDHVEVLDGVVAPDRPGLLVTDTAVEQLGVGVGDELALTFSGVTTTAPVVAVYRDLIDVQPLPGWWCSQRAEIQPAGDADPRGRPPPLVLADRGTYDAIVESLELSRAATYELPLEADGITVAEASAVVAAFDQLPERLQAATGLETIPADVLRPAAGGVVTGDHFPTVEGNLPFIAARSAAIATTLRGAVEPVSLAGVLAAGVLVFAAGTYWVDRRRGEVEMLAARGVGPVAIGLKASLETALAAAAGAAAGWGVALVLVRLLGPTTLIEPGAVADALRRAAVAAAAGTVALGAVAGARSHVIAARPVGGRASWRRFVPWELAVLAMAAWSFRRIGAEGVPVARGDDVPRIDLLALVFPLLFVAGTVALVGRVVGILLARLRRGGASWPDWLYLAARRLGGAPRVAMLLVAASAMAVGVLVYASTLTSSLRTTLAAKARVGIGSDAAVNLSEDQPIPAALDGDATKVLRFKRTDGDVDILGVDPATFADGAYWDGSFAGRSLAGLLDDLEPADPTGGRPVPALVVAGRPLPGGDVVHFLDRDVPDLHVDAVATVAAFPGMTGPRSLVVVHRDVVAALTDAPIVELWARGDPERILADLAAAGVRVRFTYSTTAVVDQSSFATVTWAFGFMQSLGVIAGLIVVGGLLLYLDTRQRSRKVSYAFLRRMGLSRRDHRRSLVAELLSTLLAGAAIGCGLACLAAWLVYRRIDPLPAVPPVPLLRLPAAVIAAVAGVVALTAWLGARSAQGTADRTSAAEVLRLGG
jgi:putative ABC transport system permease protein